MRTNPILSLLFLLSLQVASANEDRAFPIEFNGFFDGGTMYVKDLRKKGREGVTMCIDRRAQSKTREKVYLGAVYPTDPEAKIATPGELKIKLDELEALLRKYYGDQLFEKIFAADTNAQFKLVRETHPKYNGDGGNMLDAWYACLLIKHCRKPILKAEHAAPSDGDKSPN